MLDSEVLFPIVGEGLVERGILILGDVVGLSHPDGLGLVELLVLVGDLLYLLLLFVLLLLGLLLDLGLIVLLLGIVFLFVLMFGLSDFFVS